MKAVGLIFLTGVLVGCASDPTRQFTEPFKHAGENHAFGEIQLPTLPETKSRLLKAAYEGNLKRVEKAIRSENVDVKDEQGRTALLLAVGMGHPTIAQFL